MGKSHLFIQSYSFGSTKRTFLSLLHCIHGYCPLYQNYTAGGNLLALIFPSTIIYGPNCSSVAYNPGLVRSPSSSRRSHTCQFRLEVIAYFRGACCVASRKCVMTSNLIALPLKLDQYCSIIIIKISLLRLFIGSLGMMPPEHGVVDILFHCLF